MSDVSNVAYTAGIKQSFVQKTAYMAAADTDYDVSIFMNAADKGAMRTTIDDLLNDAGGTLPDNYDCKSFAEKLTSFIQNLFNKNTTEQQPLETTQQEQNEKDELNFTFETKTDAE